PPSELVAVPSDLERVVLACLAKDPAARPQSARELARELKQCADARAWSEADAEAWWSEAGSATPPQVAAKVQGSGEQVRRTVCCADLERRMAAHK
ncbi:MAG TPA: hypothetical protein VK524_29905, partial [Polyangiaceae bacterium]|nr:hypothetical protein [Polyangiaceae bacterium]